MNSGCSISSNGKKNNPIKQMLSTKKYTHFIPKISSLDARKNGSLVL